MSDMYIVRSYMLLRHMASKNESFAYQSHYNCITLAKLVILTKTAFPHQWNEKVEQ